MEVHCRGGCINALHWVVGDPNMARLAQSAERKALNLVVVGSSPTVGVDAPGGASRDSNQRGKTPSD